MLKSGKLLIVKDYVYHIKLQFERFVISKYGLKRFFQKVILDDIPILILFCLLFSRGIEKEGFGDWLLSMICQQWSTTFRFKKIGEYSILRTFISVHLIDSYIFNEWLGYFPLSYSEKVHWKATKGKFHSPLTRRSWAFLSIEEKGLWLIFL